VECEIVASFPDILLGEPDGRVAYILVALSYCPFAGVIRRPFSDFFSTTAIRRVLRLHDALHRQVRIVKGHNIDVGQYMRESE
jgi:hypothetical protein